MKPLFLSLVAIIIYISTFAQTPNGRISGKVFDSGTNNGIPFAMVYLFEGEQQRLSARTNANGNFSFINVSPKKYTLKTEKEGYTIFAKDVMVNPNFTTRLSLPLTLVRIQEQKSQPVSTENSQNKPVATTKSVQTEANIITGSTTSNSTTNQIAEVTNPVQEITESLIELSPVEDAEYEEITNAPVFLEILEEPPSPKGGVTSIYKNIRYPEIARIQKVQGTVIVSVYVDKEGNVSQIEVLKSVHPALDKAAQDVLYQTEFIPGKQGGQNTDSKITFPIKFKL